MWGIHSRTKKSWPGLALVAHEVATTLLSGHSPLAGSSLFFFPLTFVAYVSSYSTFQRSAAYNSAEFCRILIEQLWNTHQSFQTWSHSVWRWKSFIPSKDLHLPCLIEWGAPMANILPSEERSNNWMPLFYDLPFLFIFHIGFIPSVNLHMAWLDICHCNYLIWPQWQKLHHLTRGPQLIASCLGTDGWTRVFLFPSPL